MHGLALFFSVYGIVFVAELPDKTALAALVLATRHRPTPVLLGAGLALTVQAAVAVGAGSLVSLLPPRPVHIVAGALFLVSAIVMWFRKEESEDEVKDRDPNAGFWRSAWIVFVVRLSSCRAESSSSSLSSRSAEKTARGACSTSTARSHQSRCGEGTAVTELTAPA